MTKKQAYLSGVLHGDGWCTKEMGLRVKDEDFARAFADAILIAFGRIVPPRLDERGYWLTRTSNLTGRYTPLLTFEPTTDAERAAWLRGMFDSEGNAQLTPHRIKPNSYSRRVAFYSTNVQTLERVRNYLAALGMASRLRSTKNSAGHMGTRTVYELALLAGRDNYALFARVVGSNIARKRATLDALPRSYTADLRASARAAQLKGAAAKHQKTMTVTLPRVVKAVRALIAQGIKPTQQICRSIPGYNTVQPYIRQADLVTMAL